MGGDRALHSAESASNAYRDGVTKSSGESEEVKGKGRERRERSMEGRGKREVGNAREEKHRLSEPLNR